MFFRKASKPFTASLLVILATVMALIGSGCMWGVVTDGETGKPVAGANVTYTDSAGHTATTTTNAFGIYQFGGQASAAPAIGAATITVEGAGYVIQNQPVTIAYDNNHNATFANPSTFQEIQNFALDWGPGGYHDAQAGFSITFPEGWKTNPGSGSPKVHSEGAIENSTYSGECGVFVGTLDTGESLDSYLDMIVTAGHAQYTNFQEVERNSSATVGGMPAIRTVFSYEASVKNDAGRTVKTPFEDLAYLVERNRNVWVIDCKTFGEGFRFGKPVFETVAQSFRFDS